MTTFNWDARLAHELPFLLAVLERAGAARVLDVACGTGQHATALARRGYQVTGTDLSAPMIEQARGNAAAAGTRVRFAGAGFGEQAFVRFYDFDAPAPGLITFNMVMLSHQRAAPAYWQQAIESTVLRPTPGVRDELVDRLTRAGLPHAACYGGLAGNPFDPASSKDLVVVAH